MRERERFDDLVQVRCPPSLAEAVHQAARRQHLRTPEYLRAALARAVALDQVGQATRDVAQDASEERLECMT